MGVGKWIALVLFGIAVTASPAAAGKSIVVDYDAGLVYPLEDGKLVRTPIITNNGKWFKRKYLGVFPITEKVVAKRSNMYNRHGEPIRPGEQGASMPFWMRLGHTAQGFHHSGAFTTAQPRQRSNGCYRLSESSAVWLFEWAPIGTRVHIVKKVSGTQYAWLLDAGQRQMASAAKAQLPAKSGKAGARSAKSATKKPAPATKREKVAVAAPTKKRVSAN